MPRKKKGDLDNKKSEILGPNNPKYLDLPKDISKISAFFKVGYFKGTIFFRHTKKIHTILEGSRFDPCRCVLQGPAMMQKMDWK